MSATPRSFLRRADSILHVGAGIVSSIALPIAGSAAYATYQYSQYSDDSCNVFVQGVEYAVGYLVGQLIFLQLFPQLAQ